MHKIVHLIRHGQATSNAAAGGAKCVVICFLLQQDTHLFGLVELFAQVMAAKLIVTDHIRPIPPGNTLTRRACYWNPSIEP